MATTTDLLFGVKGGGSLSGESGRQIESDLKAIVAKIEAKGTTKLKFTADTAGLQAVSRQMDALQRQSAAFSRDMSGLLDGNIAKQQTLNRLMSQQLARFCLFRFSPAARRIPHARCGGTYRPG